MKAILLTEAFRSFITPGTITQTRACHGTMQVVLREARVKYHSALWVIIAFLGRRAPVAIYRVAGVWAADTTIN